MTCSRRHGWNWAVSCKSALMLKQPVNGRRISDRLASVSDLILLKKAELAMIELADATGGAVAPIRSGDPQSRPGSDFCHLPEVLGCGGEVELVSGAIGTAQTQAIEFEDALQVGEQHLHLLSLAA